MSNLTLSSNNGLNVSSLMYHFFHTPKSDSQTSNFHILHGVNGIICV